VRAEGNDTDPVARTPHAIRLGHHRGLAGATLRGLGHINVVCGQNNSGKTTLLEAIADHNKSSAVIEIDEATRVELFAAATGQGLRDSHISSAWAQSSFPNAYRLYNALLDNTDGLIGRHEIAPLLLELNRKFRDTLSMETVIQPDLAKQYLESRLAEVALPKPALIGPKRLFTSKVAFIGRQKVGTSGEHIVLELFHARNETVGSPARDRFEELQRVFTDITGNQFDVFLVDGTTNVELMFARSEGAFLKADDCGLGLEDLLVILYFCLNPTYGMLLIEEPENHLHRRCSGGC
jgi:hypothetical protein